MPNPSIDTAAPCSLGQRQNEVALMRDTLLRVRAGWREVEVLADGADRADGIPTRDAIVSTLERIGNTARPNDILVFYFSGYRSHQPVGNGLEEILLPKDARLWQAFQQGSPGIYWTRVWAIYVHIRWCQQHRVVAGTA